MVAANAPHGVRDPACTVTIGADGFQVSGDGERAGGGSGVLADRVRSALEADQWMD
jgi:hypothetical protein